MALKKKKPGRRGVNPFDDDVDSIDGTPVLFPLTKSPLQEEKISRRVVYTVLCGVMPPVKAQKLAGYSGTHIPEVSDPRTVAEIRERLQRVAGVTLADQVGFYAGIREDSEVDATNRISAAKQLDKVLGYEAPAKVEVSERREISLALQVFNNVLSKTGMSARELANVAEGQIVDQNTEERDILRVDRAEGETEDETIIDEGDDLL